MVLFCYVGMLCARAESVNRKIASGTWCGLKANVLSSARFPRKVGREPRLCATSVFSVSLWFTIAQQKKTTETQSTRRLHREAVAQET